jgi:hypothetical protein
MRPTGRVDRPMPDCIVRAVWHDRQHTQRSLSHDPARSLSYSLLTGGTSAQASEGKQTILTGRPIAAPTARCFSADNSDQHRRPFPYTLGTSDHTVHTIISKAILRSTRLCGRG